MISKRLQKIAEYINSKDSIVDIGCDHGYLSIYLYQNKITTNIIASDINIKALENAKKNFKQVKINKYIPTILSNGLDNIALNNINTIVISGMGTHTILKILAANEKLKKIEKLIIQSNNNLALLRKKIIQKGYYIADESIIFENKIYYSIICFKKGKSNKIDYDIGLIKLEHQEYYMYLLDKWQHIKKQIPHSKWYKKIKIIQKINHLKKVIRNLKNKLNS